MQFINLTKEHLVLHFHDGRKEYLPPSATVADVEYKKVKIGSLYHMMPILRRIPVKIKNLPMPKSNVIFIVYPLVLKTLRKFERTVCENSISALEQIVRHDVLTFYSDQQDKEGRTIITELYTSITGND